MKKKTVYMDNNATTPLHPEVKKTFVEMLDLYGNASSMHGLGREVGNRVEEARKTTARFLGAVPEEIVFTGGGSESNNTVLKMVTELYSAGSFSGDSSKPRSGGGKPRFGLATTTIEHPSVLSTAEYLENQGIPVAYIGVDEYGFADIRQLEKVLDEGVVLVSVMAANNEIGTLQDIKTIARAARDHGALVHTDAVQMVGKLPVDVKELDVDFLSFSGHKLYGPKGVGGLYIRSGSPFTPLIHGGHQEEGRRAGTLNSPSIIALGKAIELVNGELNEEAERQRGLKKKLMRGIEEEIPHIRVNGHPTLVLPGTLNVSFLGAEGESILLYLDMEGIEVSTGSACATGSLEPSHVITSVCDEPEYAHGSIRFSIGRENSEEDVAYVLEKLPPIISRLRTMSTMYTAKSTAR